MKIKTITYKRSRNLGNEEFEEIEITGEVDSEFDANKAIQFLRICTNHLFIFTSWPKPPEELQRTTDG